MRFGFNRACLRHQSGPDHPESAARLTAIREALADATGVEYVRPPPASVETLSLVHEASYLDDLRAFCEAGGGAWDADTVAVPATWDAALASAGLAAWAAGDALDGPGPADGHAVPFGLCRPPGHHAVADDARGFCFLNNAAVATEAVLAAGAADRVALLDVDVHHGNGTQDLFYDREEVAYLSIHERGLYPPDTGATDEAGEGDGRGRTVNVHPPPGSGDAAYAAVLDRVVAPAVTRFAPDLLLVCAGFDAHENDPTSRMTVTTEGFGLLGARVRDLARRADAGLGFVLEGGYNLAATAGSVRAINEAVEGRAPPADPGPPDERVERAIETARRALTDWSPP